LSKRLNDELAQVSPGRDSVLTVGVFDGVHKGHRHLLCQLMKEAADSGRLAGVVTLRNHPASVLSPDFKPFYLTTVDERVRLVQELGADFVVPVTFDVELSELRARQFAAVLRERLRMSGLVAGPDFAMGHKREGDVEMLTALGHDTGFSVRVVEPLVEGGRRITSTNVREALVSGDVDGAAAQLGRNFALSGTVVRGAGRGGPLGFPTANLSVPEGMAVPGDGIYAAWAHPGDQRFMAAVSIGTRPTFGAGERTIEAFVLDFEGDLYGLELRLEFVRRIRAEVRYDSVDELKAQVCKDVAETRAVLQKQEVGLR
jgi:riboflavin kinase/FMN adenylyltransferase